MLKVCLITLNYTGVEQPLRINLNIQLASGLSKALTSKPLFYQRPGSTYTLLNLALLI